MALNPTRPVSFDNWMGQGKDGQGSNPELAGNVSQAPEGYTIKYDKKVWGDMPKTHPYFDKKNHQALLQHCVQRLQMARETRDNMVERLENIDKDISAFVKLSDDDRKRMRDNRRGHGGPKPVDVSLPFVDTKLDEMVTFFSEVFWPTKNMYMAKAPKSQQDVAEALAKTLNQQARMKKHYSKLIKFMLDVMKYNYGAIVPEWVIEKGMVLKADELKTTRGPSDTEEITFEGNNLINMDMYNFFWDPSVTLTDLAEYGEFFAYVQIKSRFDLMKMAAKQQIFGIDRFINTGGGQSGTASTYYKEHPIIRHDISSTGSSDTNWYKFASSGKYGTIGIGHEMITKYIWLVPSWFGISNETALKIYRVRIMDHLYICDIEEMTNLHNMLPCAAAIAFDDMLDMQHKSPAELLTDHNRFASFTMNIHQQAMRRKLFGITVYDPSVVDLSALGTEVAGRIPLAPSGWGKPIKDSIQFHNDAPETDGLIDDVNKTYDMMNRILPTSIAEQVSNLDRATEYQAAAAVQGTSRRQFKMAKTIDDQALMPLRRMMVSNTQQYLIQPVKIDDPAGGPNQIEVPPAQFVGMDVEDFIGNGVQGMDRMMVIAHLHDIINAIIQNQQASQEIDVVELMNYWTDLMGDDFDLNQFRRAAPPQQQQVENAQNQQQANAATTSANAAAASAGQQPQQQNPGAMPGMPMA